MHVMCYLIFHTSSKEAYICKEAYIADDSGSEIEYDDFLPEQAPYENVAFDPSQPTPLPVDEEESLYVNVAH